MRKLAETVERLNVLFPTSLLQQIDKWRGKQPNPPSRATAIRQLVKQALSGKP